MKRFSCVLFSSAGVLQAGVDVTIANANVGSSLAALYNDQMQPISNPITTDAAGNLSFRVTSGIYDFLDSDGNPLAKEVQIFDLSAPDEWLINWDFPKTGFTFGGGTSKLRIYGLDDDTISVDSAMRVGGLHGPGVPGLRVSANGLGDNIFEGRNVFSDANPMFLMSSLGYLYIGSGAGNPVDIYIGRSAAGELTVGGSLNVLATLGHKGSALGFFSKPPIAKPTVIGTTLNSTTDATLIALLKALDNLGLITSQLIITIAGTAVITVGGTLLTESRRSGTAAVVIGGTGTITKF